MPKAMSGKWEEEVPSERLGTQRIQACTEVDLGGLARKHGVHLDAVTDGYEHRCEREAEWGMEDEEKLVALVQGAGLDRRELEELTMEEEGNLAVDMVDNEDMSERNWWY
jgi:hypothetical protein